MRASLLFSPRLRGPTALAATSLALSIGLAYWSFLLGEQAMGERQAATDRLSRTEARLRQSIADQPAIRDRAALLADLQAKGIAGDAGPMEWGELLHALRQEMQLPAMKYEFRSPGPAPTANSDFRATPLKLQLQLLHEEDLLNFLSRLQENAKALILLRSCHLARLPAPDPAPREGAANLQAECDLDWTVLQVEKGYGREQK